MQPINFKNLKYVVFDIECREDVDGQRNKFNQSHHLGNAVSCTLSYDGEYKDWIGGVHSPFNLLQYLLSFDIVVGYNTLGFDYPLFGGELLGEYDLRAPKFIENVLKGKTIDLCKDFHETLGARVSLQKVVTATLGESKSMDGGLAPQNWRKNKCLEVIQYCRNDVTMTKKLFELLISEQPLSVLDQASKSKTFKCVPKIR